MIIPVHKYLLIGGRDDLDTFFSRAQSKGIIEFLPQIGKKPLELPLEVQNLLHALKILRKLPVKKNYEGETSLELARETAEKILLLKAEVEKLSEEKRLLEAEIFRVAPFGDFSMEDLDYIQKEGKCELQFFCMKTDKSEAVAVPREMIYVGTDYDLDYFIAINPESKSYSGMIEMRIDRPLGELQTHLAFVKESLHQLEAELKGFAGHLEFLQEALIEHLNDYHLASVKKQVSYPLENALFSIEAWIPENKTSGLYAIIDGMAIHCEPIKVEESDKIPTYMENKGVPQIGEDLVKIYDIPASTDKDPSTWVFWFFALFFAMIVSDGGYGILYLALALFLKWKYPHVKGAVKRFIKLMFALSIACIVWGILTASFFGIEITPKNWLGKISLIQYLAVEKATYHLEHQDAVHAEWVARFSNLVDVRSGKELLDGAVSQENGHITYEMFNAFCDSILLEFSLLIGVIHLTCSFLRYLFRHPSGLGWIAFMVGGYLYFPQVLNSTSLVHFLGLIDKQEAAAIGLQLIYCGIIFALLVALIQKRLKGFGEIAHTVQVFGDALSYLRLYALGLAGAVMAETFNQLGLDVGLVFGFIVIVLGHSVNILLGVVAGVIHGLRLNFIEWYRYSFEGGGRLFRPLMRLKFKEN